MLAPSLVLRASTIWSRMRLSVKEGWPGSAERQRSPTDLYSVPRWSLVDPLLPLLLLLWLCCWCGRCSIGCCVLIGWQLRQRRARDGVLLPRLVLCFAFS